MPSIPLERTRSHAHNGRRYGTIGFVLVALVICGCSKPDRAPSASVREKLAQGPTTMPQIPTTQAHGRPETSGTSGRPVAWVNDVPIDKAALGRLLWESRGLALLQQLVLRDVARQEAERLGLEVTPGDIEREYDLTLQAARFNGIEPDKLTPVRREQLIDEWTRSRGVTRQELAIAMERQACLRACVQGEVEITDEMLQREHERVYGERVEVRHIQLAAPRTWEQIRTKLDRGATFEELVDEYSQNRLSRRDHGLLPPFTADDPSVPAVLAKVAFELKPGEVSNPIETEGAYHVLKLERRIPAEDVAMETVVEKLRRTLLARRVAEEMDRMGERLFQRCKLRIADRVLREQYTARRAAGSSSGPPLTRQ